MAETYTNLPAPSPEQGLNRYLQEIRKFPMLEPEQEYMLAKRWVDHEDAGAAHQLVTSHLRLAAKIAMGYRGYGLPQAEVISEANVGLMQAVKKFDPEKGFRLATYAMWWIRASIQEYVLRSWSMVKLGTTSGQKKLFFNLRKAKSRIGALEDGDLRPEDVTKIATDLGVSEDDVISMNRRMAMGGDTSLNVPMREDGEGQWQDWLADTDPLQDERVADGVRDDARLPAVRHQVLVHKRKRHNLVRKLLESIDKGHVGHPSQPCMQRLCCRCLRVSIAPRDAAPHRTASRRAAARRASSASLSIRSKSSY